MSCHRWLSTVWPLALAALAAASAESLRVRASAAVLPCVAAAARGYVAENVAIERGDFRSLGATDVFVGADVEVTRALESGAAVIGSEADIARVPWVLVVPPGNPLGVRTTADLARAGAELWVLGGLAGYRTRPLLASFAPEQLRESEDARALRAAPAALVPLSLAGQGERLSVEVPDFAARAVLSTSSKRPEAAAAFVRFLASERGQQAFASCPAPAR